MIPLIVNGPAIEPIAIADAKTWLKLETGDDDDVVAALITAARLTIEAHTNRMLITQTWRFIYDRWPDDRLVKLPLVPFQTLAAIRVFDASGAPQTLAPSLYALDSTRDAARIVFAQDPPMPSQAVSGIEIDVVVGYGATPDSVPEPFRQAIRVLVTDWYENRGDAGDLANALPSSLRVLLAPYLRPRLT
ncbi:MAG: head-tail connector protein [Beijerinckiaceae bacterium]